MKKNWKKILITCLVMMCVLIPSALFVSAEASSDTTTTVVTSLASGAIVQEIPDITTYRTKGAFTAPKAPDDYSTYIFAGWYTDAECKTSLGEDVTNENITDTKAYAKFVPQDILSVRAQVTKGTVYDSTTSPDANIRFVTTVDSLDYKMVGFDFAINGVEKYKESDEVYRKLYALAQDGKVMNYTPNNVFHSMSKYFMAVTVTDVLNEDFGHGITATPYWITNDGTKVSGVTAVKTVNMGYVPSMVGVTAEANFSFRAGDGVLTGDSATYSSQQGGCTDGTYWYQAFVNADPNGDNDESDNKTLIVKTDLNGNKIRTSDYLALSHTNDITYNEDLYYYNDEGEFKQGVLVICHNAPNRSRVSFMNKEDLSIIEPSAIYDADGKQMVWNITGTETESTSETAAYMEIGYKIWSIDYNATLQKYVVGCSNEGQGFRILNADFSDAYGKAFTPTDKTTGYTTQGVGSDDGYIYFILYYGSTCTNTNYSGHVIAVYDWNGKFVTVIEIPTDSISKTTEPENLSIYNNAIYIGCNKDNSYAAEIYKVNVNGVTYTQKTNEAYIDRDENNGEEDFYGTFVEAMMDAQDGETIVLINEPEDTDTARTIEVHSFMEMVSENVTITNAIGVNITLSRGSDYIGTMIANSSEGLTIVSNTTDGGSLMFDEDLSTARSSMIVNCKGSLTVDGVTVQEIKANQTGGFVRVDAGNVYVKKSNIKNNSSTGRGTALWIANGASAEVTDSVFDNNDSTSSGGSIYTEGYLKAENTSFANGEGSVGGVINCYQGELQVADCTFSENKSTRTTSQGGGAVIVTGNSKAIFTATSTEKGAFTSNEAGYNGGAIFIDASEVSIEGYGFDGNHAASGGAVYVHSGIDTNSTDTIMKEVTFSNNYASGNGGAICNHKNGKIIEFTDCLFETNYSTEGNGGAIYSGSSATVKLIETDEDKAVFNGNHQDNADAYGGAIGLGSGSLNINGYKFQNNIATGYGGAIRIGGGSAAVTDTEFEENTSTAGGGAIATLRKLTLTRANFTRNHSDGNGGAVHCASTTGTVKVTNCNFNGNDSEANGGAIYHEEGIGSDGNPSYQKLEIECTSTDKTSFTGNIATSQGGAIYVDAGNLSISGYNFHNNSAYTGGAVYLKGADEAEVAAEAVQMMTFTNSQFTLNKATGTVVDEETETTTYKGDGGAICNNGREIKLENCTVGTADNGNSATRNGGAIYVGNSGILRLNGTVDTTAVFEGNIAGSETSGGKGGAICIGSGTIEATGYTFDNNQAYGTGGAINMNNNAGISVDLSGTTFVNNKANYWKDSNDINKEGTGGAIHNNVATDPETEAEQKKLVLTNCVFGRINEDESTEGNSAAGHGGAIWLNTHAVTEITGCEFVANNTTNNRGGAIYNGSNKTTTIVDTTFKSNIADQAGAILHDSTGELVLKTGNNAAKAVFENNFGWNGGAIRTSTGGSLSITGYKFVSNTASNNGGAICADKNLELTVDDCTFGEVVITKDDDGNDVTDLKKNSAGNAGGAIYFTGSAKNCTITNSSFVGNEAKTGGAIHDNGTESNEITGSTFTGNSATTGGAIYLQDATIEAEFEKCIFKTNTATNGGAIYSNLGAAGANQVKTAATDTEAAVLYALTITDCAFGGTDDNDESLGNSATSGAGGAIYMVGGSDLILTGTDSSKAVFEGNAATGDGGAIYRPNTSNCTGVVSIENYAFAGNSAANGGAIYNNGGTLSVTNADKTSTAMFTGNVASNWGGAIYTTGGSLTISDYKFSNNSGTYGGAILMFTVSEVTNTEFEGNFASAAEGGAIYKSASGETTFTGCTFTNNYSATNGGAILNGGGKLTISGSSFSGNGVNSEGTPVTTNGGAIANYNGELVVQDASSFSGNKAVTNGGAIYNNKNKTVTIQGLSSFSENTATASGGAIYNNEGYLYVIASSFDSNISNSTADSTGGGAIFNYKGTLSITNPEKVETVKFANNKAETAWGGAIYTTDGSFTLSDYTMSGNAAKAGGAILMFTGSTVERTVFQNNNTNVTSGFDGGAIYNNRGSSFENCTFKGNGATANGGAICNSGSKAVLEITNCMFGGSESTDGNQATTRGGAIYNGGSGTITISGTDDDMAIFAYNKSKTGGAIGNGSGTITISGYAFKNNTALLGATRRGGAIYVAGGTVELKGTNQANEFFEGNDAGTGDDEGGTIAYASNTAILKITGYTLQGDALTTYFKKDSGATITVDGTSIE